MKPVVAFDNFPSFGNAGARTAPGEAKYAAGFVPADTFPAEWANYFFHGATKGISDLNSATRSIWLELENVLLAKNIQPSSDASCTSQLLEALNKIRDDAVALAYPVGTVYMNAKCTTLPAALQAIGTWCAIDGRFLRACSACIGCACGNDSVTLTWCNIPSHCHQISDHCHCGSVGQHCHTGPSHYHTVDFFSNAQCNGTSTSCSGTVWNGGTPYNGASSSCGRASTGSMSANASHTHTITAARAGGSGNACYNRFITDSGSASVYGQMCSTYNYAESTSTQHTHTLNDHYHSMGTHYHRICGNTGSCGTGNTGKATPTFTGGSICGQVFTGAAGYGCSFSILPPYRDVAMWYRDA